MDPVHLRSASKPCLCEESKKHLVKCNYQSTGIQRYTACVSLRSLHNDATHCMGIPVEEIDRQRNLECNESEMKFHPYTDICEIIGELGLAHQAAIPFKNVESKTLKIPNSSPNNL